MSAEVKHYYFDSANYGGGIRFDPRGEHIQNLGINYIPFNRSEYKTAIPGTEDGNYGTNFLKLFDPQTIFPQSQGTGSVDVIVGNKFKWLNTMIDLEIKSLGVLSLYRIPCSAAVSSLTEAITTSSTGQTYNTTVGPSTLSATQIQGHLLTATTGVGTPVTVTPGAVTTSLPVHQITQTQPYTEWTDKQEVTVIDVEGNRIRQGYSTTQSPLLMSPAFKPYYYCRFVVVRMNVSFTDYASLKNNSEYWKDFFNGLWWDRSSIALTSGPRRNMSQRVNDYNVTNPFGGMFDIIYNKKLKVNPFKVYRMRYNLKSARRGGDLITIKTNNPLIPFPSSESGYMYNNGNYFGFLLAPLSIDDFDPITQQYIIAQSPFTPGTENRKEFMRGVNDIRDNWIEPSISAGGIDYPTVLQCGVSSLYARTAYLD